MKFPYIMRAVLACACAATVLLAAVAEAAPPPAPAAAAPGAPTSDQLAQSYAAAMAAFAGGNYQAATTGLEQVIAQAPPEARLESVYFTLGAAYFNLAQYPQAVAALQTYRTKFPAGGRLAEASFSLGQAAMFTHDYAVAADAFKTLENNAAYRSQALLLEGTALKELKQNDNAIAVLEKLVGPHVHDSASANGGLLLAGLYSEKKQSDKAVALLGDLRRHAGLLDNAAQFNTLATATGDGLLEQKLNKEALACYRAVHSRDEIIKLQTERVGSLQDELTRQIAMMRADPKNAAPYFAANARLKATLQEAIQRLADFKKLPDYEPAILVRIAACFTQLERPWETIVTYEELLRRYPDDPTREAATYGLIVASSNVGRFQRTHELCELYLKDFPQGPNADSVGYLTGAIALQANDPKGAETYFGRMLDTQTGSSYRETMRFLLGNAQFAQGEYDKAQATYVKYASEFPKGQDIEEATYRGALCSVFSGAYEKAIGLLTAYVAAYPQGQFVPDARYRQAVCLYAASQNDTVIAACQDWEKQYGKAPLLGEVLSLEGDALAAKNDNPAAVDTYLRAYQAATTQEVSDYAIFAAQKLLQKAGDWPRIGEIFEQFVHDHADQPSAVMAIYWIGKARAHEGKTEEAKRFVADTIKKYITDPNREAVEQLLTQLASLCVRKAKPEPAPSPAPALAVGKPAEGAAGPAPPVAVVTPAEPTPSPALALAADTPSDPGAELDTLLGGAETDASPLARARVLYAKSELARLRRQTPVQEQDLEAIATGFKPADLSAPLLAIAGDYLLGKNHADQAGPCFERLLDAYPKSNYLDFAYNGLAEIAYDAKDYPKALQLYTDAVDKAGAAAKLKEVTIGKAKTLLALGRFDEAKPLFEQIASTREWRGESTAFAVYSLGDIMRKQNKLPEAIAYYQRVFVGYQRYLPWVAKAYAASAECFEQLGKTSDAVNTYREMVKNPKLQDFAETQTARNFLQKNGQG